MCDNDTIKICLNLFFIAYISPVIMIEIIFKSINFFMICEMIHDKEDQNMFFLGVNELR